MRREVNRVAECAVLCLKNEECNIFHFTSETNLCTLALANTLDLAKIQILMCFPDSPISKKIEVFAIPEGKNIVHDNP